jgi:hypothetical protein
MILIYHIQVFVYNPLSILFFKKTFENQQNPAFRRDFVVERLAPPPLLAYNPARGEQF